jgi:Spy/CpxP family protein refolding chaperone
MKKLVLLSAIVMCLGLASTTFGQGHYNRQDRRRIERGIRSGQLTRDEARALRERQLQIRQERRGYRSDGTITRDERRDLRQDQRELGRQIHSERHDDDRRNNNYQRRGNGYYRRGAGSPSHPVFGRRNRY